MITCPLCEHSQTAGVVCEVCGKELAKAAPAAVAISAVEGLEQTQLVEPGLPVMAAPMTELEATAMPQAPAVPAAPVPDLEAFVRAGQVAVEAVADLESGRYQDADPRTAVPTDSVTCRYCKNVQSSGLVCDKCGMRLPRIAVPRAGGPARPGLSGERTRCQSCGAQATAGARCGDCGSMVREPAA